MSAAARPIILALVLLLVGGCEPPPKAQSERPPIPRPTNQPREFGSKCETMPFGDPEAEARQALAAGDYRLFTEVGFRPLGVPGVFCPEEVGYSAIVRRGGSMSSDVPDVCGSHYHEDVPRPTMLAFNTAMAKDPGFQRVTGCRPSTYCEETYEKLPSLGGPNIRFDPKCPKSPTVLAGLAAFGTPEELRKALTAGALRSPRPLADFQDPVGQAVRYNRLDNLQVLVAAGAKLDRPDLVSLAVGGATSGKDLRPLIGYLIARGQSPSGGCLPKMSGHGSLEMAAFSGNEMLVRWLLDRGADAALELPCSSETPLDAALKYLGMYGTDPKTQEVADARRRIAVLLFQRGAGSKSAEFTSSVEKDDLRTLSIFVAAWRRQGREGSMLENLRIHAEATKRRKVLAWIEATQACRRKVMEPRVDHIRLCAD